MRTIPIVLLLTMLSMGCQQNPLSGLRGDAQEVIEDARARAGELTDLSAEELQSLWAIEYKSVEVTASDLTKVDALLNEMGRERWDCYHVSENGTRRVFYFKRNKSNAIAYLTNFLRFGAMAF